MCSGSCRLDLKLAGLLRLRRMTTGKDLEMTVAGQPTNGGRYFRSREITYNSTDKATLTSTDVASGK